MWVVAKMQDADALYEVLGRWKAAINAQRPEHMSEVFAEDAVSRDFGRTPLGTKAFTTTIRHCPGT
jgi:hypothetical protein